MKRTYSLGSVSAPTTTSPNRSHPASWWRECVAVLRRVESARASATAALATAEAERSLTITVGRVSLDPSRRRVHALGELVHLTPTEFDLLHRLAQANGRVFTREELLYAVWGYRDGSGARTVDSHVRSIRRKLGDDAIHTTNGVGYAIGDLDDAEAP